MAEEIPLYQINEQLTGIKFYGTAGTVGITADLTIESDLTINSIKTTSISPVGYSGDLTVISARRKIVLSSSVLENTSITTTVAALGITFIAYLDGSVTAQSASLKISKAFSSLTIESSTSFSPREIHLARSTTSIESSLVYNAQEIQLAYSSLTQLINVIVSDVTVYDGIQPYPLSSSVSMLIADLLRFTPNTRTPGSIVSLLLLDGQPLTAQNRKYSNSLKPNFIEKTNWNSSKSRYYKNQIKSGRMNFKLSWDWLPSEREDTIDLRFARNFIKDKSIDPDLHTLTILSYGQNPEDILEETQYNVFITGYDEELIRRDLTSNIYFWNCSLDLEEV